MKNNKQKEILERQKEKKEHDDAQFKKRLDDAGLAFQAHELPPDEVDEKDVEKDRLYSFMSMIPFTQAYYEASAAESEMDNLRKIRIEKAKASDLLAMTKMGRHEEALSKMMAETNNDFFYFNKLRTKLEEEGKVHIEAPNLNPFADFEKGKGRNRLKKAHTKRFNVVDPTSLGAFCQPIENIKRVRDDAPCTWRGKDKEGAYLQCTNVRMKHPNKMVKDSTGKEFPDILLHCPYHTPFCITELHTPDAPVQIAQINAYGMCVECYAAMGKGKAMVYRHDNAPGVAPVNIMGKTKIAMRDDENEHLLAGLTEDSVCRWKPKEGAKHLHGYVCTNKVITDPKTNGFTPFCGYHTNFCVMVHVDTANAPINTPNACGLCVSHFVASFGDVPPDVAIPFPGMVDKKKKRRENLGFHWSAPQYHPESHVPLKGFFPKVPPSGCVEYSMLGMHLLVFYW